jgi:hypothetical protein
MEIVTYAEACKADPDQILRMVRETILAEQGRERQPTGVRVEFHAPEILLDFLLSLETTRDGTANGGSGKKAQLEIVDRAVRSLRVDCRNGHPSYQWRPEEQPTGQPPATLHELSLILARHAETYGEAALGAHAASSRVGMLRAAGNAIVPQVTARFVEACIDTLDASIIPFKQAAE